MFYNSIAISLTNRCNAKCKICGASACNTSLEEKCLGAQDLEKICGGLKELPQIGNVVFSGGEPMIHFELIKKYIPTLKKMGKCVGCVTNGFIFREKSKAESMLDEMRPYCFDFLHISTDQYHLQYIDLNTIRNAIEVCKKRGISLTIKIGISKTDQTHFQIIEELENAAYGASFQFYPMMPIGRAKTMSSENFNLTPIKDMDLRCTHDTTLLVDENGDVYPCCFFARPKCMHLGNIREKGLQGIVKGARANPCFKELYLKGFSGCVNELMKHQVMKETDGYVNVCHLCNAIFMDPQYEGILNNYFKV